MMREAITIVLNEREPQKAKAADALEKRLKSKNITVSRIPIGPDIIKLIQQRKSKILVLDYLLGDYSTGLDVMASFAEVDDSERPRTVFLTDEPSVQVAVQAMRAGAYNYHELENPLSIELVVSDIETVLAGALTRPRPAPARERTIADFGAESKVSRDMVTLGEALVTRRPAIIIVAGPRGSGKSTFAAALARKLAGGRPVRHVDLSLSADPIASIIGLHHTRPEAALGKELSLVVDGAEDDCGELLELIQREQRAIWKSLEPAESHLIICTSDEALVTAWKKRLEVQVVRLAPFEQRKGDAPFFAQRFIKEVEASFGEKVRSSNSELLAALERSSWPGEMRELRSVIYDLWSRCLHSKQSPLELLAETKESWEAEHLAPELPAEIDPLTAALVLERSAYDMRRCAAVLGCSITSLQRALRSTEAR